MSPHHHAADEDLLQAALRNRSPDAQHLSEFLALPLEHTKLSLTRLHDRNLLEFDGAKIVYLSPATVSVALIQERVTAHAALMQRQLAALEELSRQFDLASHDGAPDAADGPADFNDIKVFRGDLAGINALEHMLASSRRSGSDEPQILGLMPNPNPPGMTPEHQQSLWGKVARADGKLRLLLPSSPDAVPEEALLQYAHLGVDVRWISSAPSWMWINTHTGEAALPLVWGELFPITVIVVHQPAMIAMSVALFDAYWEIGSPAQNPEVSPPWESLLRLMRPGLSLDESAKMLGITTRTARRRLEKGLQHYGVENIFALGAAWAADLENASIPFTPLRFGIHN